MYIESSDQISFLLELLNYSDIRGKKIITTNYIFAFLVYYTNQNNLKITCFLRSFELYKSEQCVMCRDYTFCRKQIKESGIVIFKCRDVYCLCMFKDI